MPQDVYSTITYRIIADLEQGTRPWLRPWSVEHAAGRITRPLRHTGEPYSGVNVLMLWMEANLKGYVAPIWMTYRQAQELGGQVRKGEKSSLVVYANTIQRTDTDEETGEETERKIPFMKGYAVFNVEQIDGLPEHFYAMKQGPILDAGQRNARAEAFLESTGASVSHGGNQAYYTAAGDHIQMPPFEFFRDPESYYATRLHETAHWTKHASRLDRNFGRKKWGDEGYAMEELVAEISSAFLGADLELEPELRDDHAAYLASWLKVLKGDKRAIFTAASHAQRVADYLHGLQPKPAPEPEAGTEPHERLVKLSIQEAAQEPGDSNPAATSEPHVNLTKPNIETPAAKAQLEGPAPS